MSSQQQPAMNIRRAVYNGGGLGGRYDAPERPFNDSISNRRVQIAKRDRRRYPPRHALYEHSRSPKRRQILPNSDSWGADPYITPISLDHDVDFHMEEGGLRRLHLDDYSSRPDRYSPSCQQGRRGVHRGHQ
jgi:hypothetical protein